MAIKSLTINEKWYYRLTGVGADRSLAATETVALRKLIGSSAGLSPIAQIQINV